MSALDLPRRPRRLRRNAATRSLVEETRISVNDLIQPLFVIEGGSREDVPSMPGVLRLPLDELVSECRSLDALGIRAVALFPCVTSDKKDSLGSYGLSDDNLLFKSIRAIKNALPDMIVVADVALDPYTDHGHDGILDDRGEIDNDATVRLLSALAVREAEAGADWVAPSDMMDGRIGAIRRALDENGHIQTVILAYSAKFASAFYGPFRDAVGSAKAAGYRSLDKRSYQLNSANVREAVGEAILDEEEGADILMVKPAGPYLDIIRAVREQTLLPVAAYQVSGEYAQIHAAAQLGWLDLQSTRDEALLSIKRAGADIILTYFAADWAKDHLSHTT